jgi:hypothetical protein
MHDDLLAGIKAIAAHMGLPEDKTARLHRSGELRTFVRGRTIFARKSQLDEDFRASG